MLHLLSDPSARPFDIAFNPDPAFPPNVTHACPYTSIGTDITISRPTPCPNFDLDSPEVSNILSANADAHLQVYKKQKLNRGNKRNPTTGTTIPGDGIIGDILHNNMTLIPFAIDPFGRLGLILCHFLFGTRPTVPLSFPPPRPHATEMYKHITTFPSSTGILQLADKNWTIHRPHHFFGHSYSSPTPIHFHPSSHRILHL
jgi:hypothetical protein